MKTLLINPSRRKKRRGSKRRRARASAPRRRRRSRAIARPRRRKTRAYGRVIKVRRVRRNPSGLKGAVLGQLMPAATGAAGALALDVTMGYLGHFIPDSLKTGPVIYATKAGIAIGLGMVASQFLSSNLARQATLGALTVVLHDAAKDVVATTFPAVPLGEFVSGVGFANAGSPVALGFDAGMGEYVSGASDYIASDGAHVY